MRSAKEIAADIRSLSVWDESLLFDLCEAAGMMDEWNAADSETFEAIAFKAAEKLGVEIL